MKTSVMLESYCAEIERLVREGMLRPALRLAVALPDICAALEHPQLESAPALYESWCANWLTAEIGGKSLPADRLHRLYVRVALKRGSQETPVDPTAAALGRMRMSRRARRERTPALRRVWEPTNPLQSFQVGLIEALVDSSRRWYRDTGAGNALVQRNLGRLLVSG